MNILLEKNFRHLWVFFNFVCTSSEPNNKFQVWKSFHVRTLLELLESEGFRLLVNIFNMKFNCFCKIFFCLFYGAGWVRLHLKSSSWRGDSLLEIEDVFFMIFRFQNINNWVITCWSSWYVWETSGHSLQQAIHQLNFSILLVASSLLIF